MADNAASSSSISAAGRRGKKDDKKSKKEKSKSSTSSTSKLDTQTTDNSQNDIPVVYSPFQELSTVWEHSDPAKQREVVAELFEMDDRPGVCVESIQLDFTYLNLLFAQEAGFNIEQTKVFWKIMDKVIQLLKQADTTLPMVAKYVKDAVLANSPLASHFAVAAQEGHKSNASSTGGLIDPLEHTNLSTAPISLDSESAAVEETPSPALTSSSSNTRTTRRDRSDTNLVKAKRGKKKTEEEEKTEEIVAAEEAAKKKKEAALKAAAMFTVANVKQITAYVGQSLMKNFTLYRVVFCSAIFTPRVQNEVHAFRLENVIPDGLSLADAVDLTSEFEATQAQQAVHEQQMAEADAAAAEADDESDGKSHTNQQLEDGQEEGEEVKLNSNNGETGEGGDAAIEALVADKVSALRQDMLALLEAQQKTLEAKLEGEQLKRAPSRDSTSSRSKKKKSKKSKKRATAEAEAE